MDEPVELHDIVGHTASVGKGTVYEILEAFKDDENEYIKISTLAETMTDSSTDRDNHTKNVD